MRLFRTIVSLSLASIVLIASIGVTLNFHLCAGRVQSVAVFLKAQPCQDAQMSCHGTMNHSKKNGCCEEKSIVLKGKESAAEVKSAVQLHPSFNLIGVILPVLYSIVNTDATVTTPQYAIYKPPLLERDITILVQSFLI